MLFDDRLLRIYHGPSLSEKIDMLFMDVETEGKKRGYERASAEYAKAYRKLEKEYKETKRLIERQKEAYDAESEELIKYLESLEERKKKLEKQIASKKKLVAKKYGVSLEDIDTASTQGMIIMPDVLTMIYRHKERKLIEAEQKGYIEAKGLYEQKIKKLKDELKKIKDKGSKEIKKLVSLINDALNEIAKEEIIIAELELALKNYE